MQIVNQREEGLAQSSVFGFVDKMGNSQILRFLLAVIYIANTLGHLATSFFPNIPFYMDKINAYVEFFHI